MMELPDVIACMPRMAGDWQHFSSLLAFVFLAWAFRNATQPRQACGADGAGSKAANSSETSPA